MVNLNNLKIKNENSTEDISNEEINSEKRFHLYGLSGVCKSLF